MPTGAALVRWAGGWAERVRTTSVTAYTRSEALLGLGAVGSLAEMRRVADGQLDEFATPRHETAAGIAPVDATEEPYIAFRVGDTITVPDQALAATSERVHGLTIGEDADGNALITVASNDLLIDERSRVMQALKKMANGTLVGRSKVATPVLPTFQPRGIVSSAGCGGVIHRESFDKADDGLGPDLTWSSSGAAVRSGQATWSVGGVPGRGRAEHDLSVQNQYAQFVLSTRTLGAFPATSNWIARVTLRMHALTADPLADTHYAFEVRHQSLESTATYRLYHLEASLATTLFTATGGVPQQGQTMRFEIVDDVMYGTMGGVLMVSGAIPSVPTPATGVRAGFLVDRDAAGDDIRVDQFECGDAC